MARDGVYRTQYETGTSAGGLDAVLGGARTRWEQTMFGSAYDDASVAVRPRYGGLDLGEYADGACPRFGSCHLRLQPHVLDRATFTWGDSHSGPEAFGVWDVLEPVIAAALADEAPDVVGVPREDDRLDGYIEAHIHSQVVLRDDVEAIVADPSFRGQPVGGQLERMAREHAIELIWHRGFVLDPAEVGADFKTELSPLLAQDVHERLARPGQRLDAELVGRAAQAVVSGEGDWSAYGDDVETLQELKYLWHHLVAFGRPWTGPGSTGAGVPGQR